MSSLLGDPMDSIALFGPVFNGNTRELPVNGDPLRCQATFWGSGMPEMWYWSVERRGWYSKIVTSCEGPVTFGPTMRRKQIRVVSIIIEPFSCYRDFN